jgi:hypothetical protein
MHRRRAKAPCFAGLSGAAEAVPFHEHGNSRKKGNAEIALKHCAMQNLDVVRQCAK